MLGTLAGKGGAPGCEATHTQADAKKKTPAAPTSSAARAARFFKDGRRSRFWSGFDCSVHAVHETTKQTLVELSLYQ